MNNLCPNCQTAYSVQPQHVGRRITCKKCGAGLVVEAEGLKMTEPPPATKPDETDPLAALGADEDAGRVVKPRRSLNITGSFAEFFQGAGQGLATILFGAGTFFVIVFLFFPIIDQAKVERARLKVNEDEVKLKDEVAKLREAGGKPEKSSTIDTAQKTLESSQKARSDAESAAAQNHYWYLWGMLLGFILLAGGSLGYLGSEARIRRVLGCIILASQLLLVFLIIVIGRGGTTIR